MTVDELEALIEKAETVSKSAISVHRSYCRVWEAVRSVGANDIYDATFDQVIAKLREWATPPRPETLTITVPFGAADKLVNGPEWMEGGRVEPFAAACREALKPWAQS